MGLGRALAWTFGAGPIYEIMKSKQHSTAKREAKLNQATPVPKVGGEDDGKLKPGQKVNAIYTSPQGILNEPSTARATLLGGSRNEY